MTNKTIAKLATTVVSGSGTVSAVTLWKGPLGYGIRIDGTPGSWYLSTLLENGAENVADRLWVDLGQGWYVVGTRAAVNEALSLIVGKAGV